MTDFELCAEAVVHHIIDFLGMVAEIIVGKPLRSL